MNNSKLLETLRAFSPEERHRLGLFLHSPYFQKDGISDDEIRLFDYLNSLAPYYAADEVAKRKVFEVLYPGGTVVKGKLEKRMSALLNQIQRFIIQERWEVKEEPVRKLLRLSHFYQEREVPRLYDQTLGQIQKILANSQQKDKIHFLNEFLVQSEIAEYQSFNNTRKDDLNLPTALRSLDVFYIAQKLEYLCALLLPGNSQIPLEIQDDLDWLNTLHASLSAKNYLEIPLIKTYFTALTVLQQTENTQPYGHLLELLQQYREELSEDDLKALRAICRNFSVYQFNQGKKEYLEEAFRLYQEDLKSGLLYHKDGLLPGTIRNMVSIGLKQEQYDWVYQLLQEHKDRIVGTKYPRDVYHFNLANYYFELKDYDNALKLLADHYDDLYYQIAAKRLEIKVHYEEDSVLLEPKLDAFKVFVYRLSKKQFPERHKLGNQNFFNALRQIISPLTHFDNQRIERLIAKVKNQKIIVEKEWLLEKLYVLKSKNL